MKRACEALAISPLFKNLNHEIFSEFCARLNIRIVYKGEVLVNEGDDSKILGIVLEGQLAVQKYASNGDFVTLNLLGEGDAFGEDLIFSSNRFWPHTIEAVTHSKVITMTTDILKPLFKSSPELVVNFLMFLSDRLQAQNSRISILSQRTLRQKIAGYLLDLYRHQQQPQRGPGTVQKIATPSVELPVSKEVVARLLAMPRPSFSRELVKMEKDGLIKKNGRVIWLTDLDSLESGVIDGLGTDDF